MNRLNGADCLIYSNDGIYKGKYVCFIEVEDNQDMGILRETPISNKRVNIIIKNIKESLMNCKLTIFNYRNSNYFALKNYIVKNEKIDNDEVWINDDEQNIKSKIEQIEQEEYERLKTKGISYIEWNNINIKLGKENLSKDKSFEYLCVDLINKIKIPKEGDFHPRGGTDEGRDYIWKWPTIDNPKINYLDLPEEKWVMQCKYSENPNTKLTKTEVWDEIIKVVQHNPSHYIIFTNRNITTSFYDWWTKITELDNRKSKFIPFTLHLVGRENIEKLLNLWPDIKEKYFMS